MSKSKNTGDVAKAAEGIGGLGCDVVGIDVSLNHAALILLRDGKLRDLYYITNIAGSAARDKERSMYLPVEPTLRAMGNDRHRHVAWRLRTVSNAIWTRVMTWLPDYIAIEDYALRAEQGSHQMGEIGGVVRWMLYNAGLPFRLHDPTTLKMWVAHDGTCQKDEVEASVQRRWGEDFSRFNGPPNPKTGKANRQTSEDLADAFGLAQMGWAEVLIRRGLIRLDQLHEKEIRVFNRITKYQPVPLISRDWIDGQKESKSDR